MTLRLKEMGKDQILKVFFFLPRAKVVGLNLVGNMEITCELVLSDLSSRVVML